MGVAKVAERSQLFNNLENCLERVMNSRLFLAICKPNAHQYACTCGQVIQGQLLTIPPTPERGKNGNDVSHGGGGDSARPCDELIE